jgi:hypothetical protein
MSLSARVWLRGGRAYGYVLEDLRTDASHAEENYRAEIFVFLRHHNEFVIDVLHHLLY